MTTEKDNDIRRTSTLNNLPNDRVLSIYLTNHVLIRGREDKDGKLWEWFKKCIPEALGSTVWHDTAKSRYVLFMKNGSFISYDEDD